MRRLFCAFSCALLLFAVCCAGCAIEKPNSEPEEIDATTPVLTLGEDTITYSVYKALYDNYLPYMQYNGYDPLTSVESLESFQDWIIDLLAEDLVVLYQSKLNGFTLNEEQEARLAAELEDELQDIYDQYYKYAEEDYTNDPSLTVDAYFEGYINQVSEYYTGIAMSWEDYQIEYSAEKRRSFIITEYKALVSAEFIPATEDVISWYDSEYDSDKTNYTDSPGKYKTDMEYYEQYFGQKDDAYPVTYAPSGYSRVMHIIITPEGELSKEYGEKIAEMETLEAEYKELAFSDALNGTDVNSERMAELLTEYVALKQETDKEFAAFTEAALDKAEQAYAALEAGQPFSEVMLEYTEDTTIVGDENTEGCLKFQEKGQLISLVHKSSSDWSDGIKEQFEKLRRGEYSEIFMDNGSYHILYYVSKEAAGDIPLSSIYNDVLVVCASIAQQSQWEALLDEWKNDPALVKNEELIRLLGMDSVKGADS